jgi:nitrogen fixation-related uncharacterized protein
VYFLGWILLVALSLALSFAAFAWAVGSGQLADQGRARYLALGEESSPAAPPAPSTGRPAKIPAGVYALAAVGTLVCLGLAAPLVLSLLRHGR